MSKMIRVAAAELSGAALRYAVAVVQGYRLERIEDGNWKEGEPHWWQAINEKAVVPGERNGLVGYIKPGAKGVTSGYDYCPDVDWGRGGPLIFTYEITVYPPRHLIKSAEGWGAQYYVVNDPKIMRGPTPLVAVCRAIVSAHLGDSVEVPAELVEGGAA